MRKSSDVIDRMEKMKPRGGGNRNSGHRSAVSFKIQNLQEKSDSGDERETKRQFGVLREFLYFCSPKQKVVDP